jgi:hypothetical protein
VTINNITITLFLKGPWFASGEAKDINRTYRRGKEKRRRV